MSELDLNWVFLLILHFIDTFIEKKKPFLKKSSFDSMFLFIFYRERTEVRERVRQKNIDIRE